MMYELSEQELEQVQGGSCNIGNPGDGTGTPLDTGPAKHHHHHHTTPTPPPNNNFLGMPIPFGLAQNNGHYMP